MTLARDWFFAFLATCALEVPIVLGATWRNETRHRRSGAVAVLAQVLTHPLVWFAFPALPWLGPESRFWLSELFAWLAEAALYASLLSGVSSWRALGIAGLANGVSLGAGLLFTR